MTKQYTNTREPGEFGDGVTVEKMTDADLVEKLRSVNIAIAPYACPEAADWCHEAADRLSALSPRVGVVKDEKRAEVREKFAGIHKALDDITAALSSAGEKECELSHAAQILETVDDSWFQGDGSEPSPHPTSADKLEVVAIAVNLARAAWSLCDNTADSNPPEVQQKDWDDLAKALDAADGLPDVPGLHAGPASRLEYALTRIITEQAERIAELEAALVETISQQNRFLAAQNDIQRATIARAEAAEADRDRMKEALDERYEIALTGTEDEIARLIESHDSFDCPEGQTYVFAAREIAKSLVERFAARAALNEGAEK